MDNSSTFNWTTKNLDVDKFRNGDIIFEAKTTIKELGVKLS